jgi:Uma2 family endonuclease
MATTVRIPLTEYLQTTYRPDREYVDGEARVRNVGKWEHARVHWLLAAWFGAHEKEWDIIGSTGQRVQTGRNIRVPDLVVLKPGPQPDVLVDPPLLVIEILSPDDSYSETQEKARDYQVMGVETVWLIDPKTRTGRMCSGADWSASSLLVVAGTALYVDLDVLFGQLVPPQPAG